MSPATISTPPPRTPSSRLWTPDRPDPLRPTAADLHLAAAAPAGFAYVASRGEWLPAAHLRLISERIVDVVRSTLAGVPRRLMVFMPPRHGKSELISRYTPAWFLGNHPELRVILTSYGATLAFRFGRESRNVLREVGPPLFGVGVDQESSARDRWATAWGDPEDPRPAPRGGMLAAGVGGGITGEGAHLFIIDDPVKDQEEAASEVIQERNIDWWRSTARTRLMPGGSVIVLQTRWHENDLSGALLAMAEAGEGDDWEVLSLPALTPEPEGDAEPEPDALGRGPAQALWPAMYDEASLAATKRALGIYWWQALYQQDPLPAGGLIFQRTDFRYYTVEQHAGQDAYRLDHGDGRDELITADHVTRIVTVDPAMSEKETADYTVIALWAVTPSRDLILLELERVHFEQPDVKGMVTRTWTGWGKPLIRVESKAAGTALIQDLVRDGYPIGTLEADTDKVTRARGAVPRYEAHTVFHPPGAPWLATYEKELLAFPNGKHDDQVDAFSYAALWLPNVPLRQARKTEAKAKPVTAGLKTRRF